MLSEKIKKLRENKNLQQKDLVDYLKIAKSTYSQYESGTRMPSLDIIMKIAEFYNVSIDYLLGHEVVAEETAEYTFENKKEMIKEIIGPGVEIHFEDINQVTPEQLKAMKAVWESLKNNDKKK